MIKRHIWETIPDLKINWILAPYPVLNENAVRKNAMIIFVLWSLVFSYTLFTKDFTYFNILVPIIFIDFTIKVFIWPKYSIFSKIANYLVRKQKIQYVWAIQKRFAWTIWFLMAWATSIMSLWFWITCGLPILFCYLCLIFMLAEAFYWYCVWCAIYTYLRGKWLIKEKEYNPICADWSCEIKK